MVAGTLSPSDQMSVTVMPAGSHERGMGETVTGHGAVCAMALPFTAWKHIHFIVTQVARSAAVINSGPFFFREVPVPNGCNGCRQIPKTA